PSRLGSSTSMMRTSGSSSLTTSTTSRPLPASPTIWSALELAIRALIASRTISWSSQRTTRFASLTLVLIDWLVPSSWCIDPCRRTVGMQNSRYREATVALLSVLDQGHDGASYGDGCAVEGVHCLWCFAVGRSIPTGEPPRLVIGRVRA